VFKKDDFPLNLQGYSNTSRPVDTNYNSYSEKLCVVDVMKDNYVFNSLQSISLYLLLLILFTYIVGNSQLGF